MSAHPHRVRRADRAPHRNERGVVLLLVLGILTLLSLLAVSFVFRSRLELRAAQNFSDTVSADDVALAGVDLGKRLLEADKRLRRLGPDGVADSGDERPFDSLIDLWRGSTGSTVRIVVGSEANNTFLKPAPGDILAETAGIPSTGVVVSWDNANLTLVLLTENPQALAATDTLIQVDGGTAPFFADVVTVQIPSNDIDLNDDATIQAGNTIDDDNDGTPDPVDEDEGLDGVWHNYYDQQGRLVGRFAVLIEDESAKANVNAIHNLAGVGVGADLDPTDNVFSQNSGATTFEIDATEALNADAGNADQLVLYRRGLPRGTPAAGVAYVGAGNETNRIYVPGQGRSEAAGYSDQSNDDDNANRVFLGADGVDNDGDGQVGLPCAVDPNCDEADEGVNEPQEFVARNPVRRQPQAPGTPEFGLDGVNNDGDSTVGPPVVAITDEPNEGDDQPILALEDLVSVELVAMPPGAGNPDWLRATVRNAAGDFFTQRRNLTTIQSEDRNLNARENPRVNPNYATAGEIAAAVLAPFLRNLPAFTEAEFRAYQAAINLYDYRDRNFIRDEVQDTSGNVFAGVEAVRINEIMVAPATRLFEGEEGDGAPGVLGGGALAWDSASDSVTPTPPDAAGSPRVLPDFLHSDPGLIIAQFSTPVAVTLPAGTVGPPKFLDALAATDNDGDGATNEDIPANPDGDAFFDEDPVNGVNEDGDAATDEDGPTDVGVDGLIGEDGSNAGIADVTARFIVRCRTNANASGIAAGNADRGFMVFVNSEAIWPGGAAAGGRWGIPATILGGGTADGEWFVQQGICRVVPGANTVQFLKPVSATAAPVDRIDVDWFYISFEPDAEWIELANLSPTGVDISGWRIQTEAVLDSNLTDATTPVRYSVSVTVPAGTVLPPGTAGGPSYTVLAVDAFGAGTVPVPAQPTTTGNFAVLDQEAGDADSPDAMAYDKLWPTATSAAPTSTNPQAIQLTDVLNLYAPAPRTVGLAVDGIDNDGDGIVDETDEEADDFMPFTELFPNEPINDILDDQSNIDARSNGTNIIAPAAGSDNDEDGLVDEPDEVAPQDEVWTDIDVATVSLLDADGNVMDRVTYDAQDIAWATDVHTVIGANEGFGVLERRSPLYAGDRLLPNRSARLTGGADIRLDTFTLDKYDQDTAGGAIAAWRWTAVPVLADGNYDDWTPPLLDDPAPTPGRVNRSPLGTAVEPVGQEKGRFLATVGELGRVPFDDGHPYDLVGLDTLRLDDDLRGPVLEDAATAMTTVVTALDVSAADAALLTSLVTGAGEPIFLRDHAADRREHMRVTGVAGTTVTVVRGEQGPAETHLAGAQFDVLVGNPPFRRVQTVGYRSSTTQDPAVGNTIANASQGGATRVILRVDTTNDRMLLWDDGGNAAWQIGDLINNGAAFGAAGDVASITSLHTPEAPDVAQLVDSFSLDAIVLEPTRADVTLNGAGWSDTSALTDPTEYSIAAADTGSTVDMVWDITDNVEAGTYCLYVFGQSGTRLQVEVLDETDTPIASLTAGGPPANDSNAPAVGLTASAGDNIAAYGPLTIPYSQNVGTQLRLRFTNAGPDIGSTVPTNRISRVVLAPAPRTPGRINLNTATGRVLRGLPNLTALTRPDGGGPTFTIAERIIEDRRINGPFTSIGDLMSSRRGLNNAVRTNIDTLTNDGQDNDADQQVQDNGAGLAIGGTTLVLVAGQGVLAPAGSTLVDLADVAPLDVLVVESVATDTLTLRTAATETHLASALYVVNEPTETDEPNEAENIFEAIANLVTVRSDVYKLLVIGEAATDANGDGIIQAEEVRAQRKLEVVYER